MTVMGYDLLNEPLPNEWQHTYGDELALSYDLTAAIRAIDPDHLIMYEGSHWATNWEIFTEVWDDNSLLQFHRYWLSPDRASIAPYLETRDRLGLPIYMGEGGENTSTGSMPRTGSMRRTRSAGTSGHGRRLRRGHHRSPSSPPMAGTRSSAAASATRS